MTKILVILAMALGFNTNTDAKISETTTIPVTLGTGIIDRIENRDSEVDVVVVEFDGEIYDIEHYLNTSCYNEKNYHKEGEKIRVALVDDYLECMTCYDSTLHEVLLNSMDWK